MPDDDYIALLIGRIILGWGRLDQLLNSELEKMTLSGQPDAWPHQLKIPDSFTARLNMWEKLCASMYPNDPAKLYAVNSVIDAITKQVDLRNGLAHGFAMLSRIGRGGVETERLNLHIYRRKETQRRLAANEEAFKNDPMLRFWAEDLHSMYTIQDLEAGLYTISNLETAFRQAADTHGRTDNSAESS